MKKLLPLLFLIFSGILPAADLNGYTSAYECRAGGPNCNVDVVSLANQACQQIFTTSTTPTNDWSALNQSNNVICIQAGDHTARGTLTLTASAGPTYKVLRYYRASDNNDQPWIQSAGNRAKIRKIVVEGNYWIVQRLTVDYPNTSAIVTVDVANDVIFNRMLIQGAASGMVVLSGGSKQNRTIQNSVIRQNVVAPGADRHCIKIDGFSLHTRIINNEIYDCGSDGLQTSRNSGPRDFIIENNDIYQTSAMYCDADGTPNPSGVRSGGENGLDLKEAGDDSAWPLRAIHNRIWGFRDTATACGSSGSNGEAIIFHNNSSTDPGETNMYGLIQNNVLWDGTNAVSSPNATPTRWSVVGNLVYDMTHSLTATYAIDGLKADTTEYYLNTIINASNGIRMGGGTGEDVRCNMLISAGAPSGTASQFDYNAYYNSTTAGETHLINRTVSTRANTTGYTAGDMIQTGAITGCTTGAQTACFAYKAMTTGTSAGSSPTMPTTLGGTVVDGTPPTAVTWKAVMGPYIFYRKLLTAPEQYAIPRARIDPVNVPHAKLCPGIGKTDAMGSRGGIGVNDKILTLGDSFWDSLIGARP